MSGLCMAYRLKKEGYDDIVIFEKAGEVGGTWRENRYPGLTCDVPSRYYSYSFSPNPDWSHIMSPGAEIFEYFKKASERFGAREHIVFNAQVTDATWREGRWHLSINDGESTDVVDILVTATGLLHQPRFPEISGLDTFSGTTVHSAQWDPELDATGKRVGLIGTGSTGVQITTAVSEVAAKLTVFQRTPQWVLYVPNLPTLPFTKHLLRAVPKLNEVNYKGWRAFMESTLGKAAIEPGVQRTVMASLTRASMRVGIRDKALRAKLTPDYEPLCKRIVISSKFFPAMQRGNVHLETSGIDHVEPRGIVTADGNLHELDVLVLATGFDVHAFMRPMTMTGADGVTLDEVWADGPTSYQTVMLPKFPNLFMLVGPHSPFGNQSIIGVAETQTQYVMRWLDLMQSNDLAWVSPTQEAMDTFNDERRKATPKTAAASGCQSWYLGNDGLPELWPWTPDHHRKVLSEPVVDDFEVTTLEEAAADAKPRRVRGSKA